MKQKLVDYIKSKYADNAIGIDLTELYNQCTIHEIKEIDLIIQNWIDENKIEKVFNAMPLKNMGDVIMDTFNFNNPKTHIRLKVDLNSL
jgi:hypothetical protein